ncbi:hypothetical protein [Chryseobacterium sp. RR2-3-20]|uniref:hypothetical protein n=1 Tax=Chryseobacterium sp. RR2-3-20 TaxID=2787626 RepID=UPI001AE04A82|nr:hypothetical protein [Chryseobacterium sp. RR2-3-20]
MADLIENIILLKQRLTNLQTVDFGIKGSIKSLKSTDINIIKNVWNFIDEIFKAESNETIYIDNIHDFLSFQVEIIVKIGDVPGYYKTFNNFLSSNKIKCLSKKFYIEELNYREDVDTIIPSIVNAYKLNLQIILLLSKIADYKKEQGNKLELFFYKSEKGVSLDVAYSENDLYNLRAAKIVDLKTQLLDSIDSSERKQLFLNELISDLDKNGSTYANLLKDWETIIANYEKSFKLYLSGFSFDKIKTSSLEYFQKLSDRLYDSINKVSSYIFGIPIGYILLINNFDFKGEQTLKNISLVTLGILFFLIMWFVFFKNIAEAIGAIEGDIRKFKEKIENRSELKEITTELSNLEDKSIKSQKNKLFLVKVLSAIILIVTILIFLIITIRTDRQSTDADKPKLNFVKIQ